MADLQSSARRFLEGRCTSERLLAQAINTPSAGPDDGLIGVILGHGNTDASTDAGLSEALQSYFDSVRS